MFYQNINAENIPVIPVSIHSIFSYHFLKDVPFIDILVTCDADLCTWLKTTRERRKIGTIAASKLQSLA